MEKWKNIKGKEGLYQVSNYGRVKSVERIVIRSNGRQYTVKEKILPQYTDNKGYLRCSLGKIHRLVAEAFIPNPNNYETVHHKDHNQLNNNTDNLEWIDKITHDRLHGGQHPSKKVFQYYNDSLINIYMSTQEAARQNIGYGYSNIARCCRGEQETYKGFKWSYTKK